MRTERLAAAAPPPPALCITPIARMVRKAWWRPRRSSPAGHHAAQRLTSACTMRAAGVCEVRLGITR